MIGFSLIGTPAGYESLHMGLNKTIDIDSHVDLNNRSINIFPNSEIFRIIRVINQNKTYILFVCYNYALEINNTREGTYYGSVLTFENCTSDANHIVTALRDLSQLLRDSCIDQNSRYVSTIKSINKANTPESVLQLDSYITNLPIQNDSILTTTKQIYLIVDHSSGNIISSIDKIIQDEIFLEFYSTYVSDDNRVKNYVLERKLLSAFTFQELLEKRNQSIKSLRLENEKQKNLIEQTQQLNANLQLEIKQFKKQYDEKEKQYQTLLDEFQLFQKELDEKNNFYERQLNEQSRKFQIDRGEQNKKFQKELENKRNRNTENRYDKKIKHPKRFVHEEDENKLSLLKYIFFLVKHSIHPIAALLILLFIISIIFIVPLVMKKSFFKSEQNKSEQNKSELKSNEIQDQKTFDNSNHDNQVEENGCIWKPEVKWVYMGSDFENIEDLAKNISSQCHTENCLNWINSLQQFILDNNQNDINDDGKIIKFGNILLALPVSSNLDNQNFKHK